MIANDAPSEIPVASLHAVLHRHGSDPHALVQILREVQDLDHINALLAAERQQNPALEGMHDIDSGTHWPPLGEPIALRKPAIASAPLICHAIRPR